MNLALNNLQRLICHKTQTTNQTNHDVNYTRSKSIYNDQAKPAHHSEIFSRAIHLKCSERKKNQFPVHSAIE